MALPSSRASRRCWRNAPACRSSGCRATRSPPSSSSGWSACPSCGGWAGCEVPPPEPTVSARLSPRRRLGGRRLDVVQVAVNGGLGRAALRAVCPPVRLDEGRRLHRGARGRHRPRRRPPGRGHPVTGDATTGGPRELPQPSMTPASPFISDIPAAQALQAWRAACAAARCPARVPAVENAGRRGRGPRDGGRPSGPSGRRRRSTRRVWTGSPSGRPHGGSRRDHPGAAGPVGVRGGRHRRPASGRPTTPS